jgi:hypothetical protein
VGDIAAAEQSYPATPAAGRGAFYFDNVLSSPVYVDDAGRKWVRANRTAIATQSGFATDTYVTNSGILIPSFGLQAMSMFEWTISASKTGAGVATPIYKVRIGTTQSTADAAPLTLTGPAQTANADVGILTILVTMRNLGAAGILQGTACWSHDAAALGFANNDAGAVEAASTGFDTQNLATAFLGLSINGGASAAWTITQVRSIAIW